VKKTLASIHHTSSTQETIVSSYSTTQLKIDLRIEMIERNFKICFIEKKDHTFDARNDHMGKK
jgi:hypothetical protein